MLRIRVCQVTDQLQLQLCCALRAKSLGQTLQSSQNDNNSERFYCRSDEPFLPGQRFACEISIPATVVGTKEKSVKFNCRVKVLQVELNGLKPGFGVTFSFES